MNQAPTSSRTPKSRFAPTPGSTLSVVEVELMRAMRRNQDLIAAYRGQQPADRNLKDELEWALDAFMRRDEDRMRRLGARMNDNLPPVESNADLSHADNALKQKENYNGK